MLPKSVKVNLPTSPGSTGGEESENNIAIVGIDYSMSTPCACICYGDFKIENCQFVFLTDTKKYVGSFADNQIIGLDKPSFKTNEERFNNLSDIMLAAITYLTKHKHIAINLEGYAMGAKGQVFHIGENTGVLKNKINHLNVPLYITAPTQVKKLATGKGNAKKDIMYNHFLEETKLDLIKKLDYNKTTIDSPIGDIVDSFYICKFLTTEKKLRTVKLEYRD